MSWWWSWLLALLGLFGLWLAGNRNMWAWRIGIAVQVLWVAYALTTRQWGFIASALGYAGVNLRNLLKWRRERSAVQHPEATVAVADPPPPRLPDLPQPPRRYSTESDAAYRERCWRWRVWLHHEQNRAQLGGPMMSYAPETEVQAWRQWASQGVAA